MPFHASRLSGAVVVVECGWLWLARLPLWLWVVVVVAVGGAGIVGSVLVLLSLSPLFLTVDSRSHFKSSLVSLPLLSLRLIVSF